MKTYVLKDLDFAKMSVDDGVIVIPIIDQDTLDPSPEVCMFCEDGFVFLNGVSEGLLSEETSDTLYHMYVVFAYAFS